MRGNVEETKIIKVEEESKERIDKFISNSLEDLTRSAIKKLIESNNIYVNEKTVACSYKVRVGDVIKIVIPQSEPIEAVPENIPIDIAYEDDDLLVVNKKKGMVVHPAAGN